MSQPDGRYKSRGRKERTPEQLKVLAMAREKAKLVIQERHSQEEERTPPQKTLNTPTTLPRRRKVAPTTHTLSR